MSKKHPKYSSEFKAKVALTAMRGDEHTARTAKELGLGKIVKATSAGDEGLLESLQAYSQVTRK